MSKSVYCEKICYYINLFESRDKRIDSALADQKKKLGRSRPSAKYLPELHVNNVKDHGLLPNIYQRYMLIM